MSNRRIQPRNAWEREMLRKELLIDWRNYLREDTSMSDEEVEDWLTRIEDCLKVSTPEPH
jgi:hypothetical protein